LFLRALELLRREDERVDDAVEPRPDSPKVLDQACPILHVADDEQIEIAGA
jgi:hypothetical protein